MTTEAAPAKSLTVWGATFLGVGGMIGAGIFALLGQAGAVAGSAVWLSFLVGGGVALLQGYSFAKLGARYPVEGGTVDYLALGFGNGQITGIASWMMYASALVTGALVASSFGAYATALIFGDNASAWIATVLTIALIVVLTLINLAGADLLNRFQTVIVVILLAVLGGLALVLLGDIDTDRLARSTYPPMTDILSSVALTFFAYLGFSVISFAGQKLPNPAVDLPRAMYRAIGITIVTYTILALGVFGVLPLDDVIRYGDTALAKAAEPSLGQTGYTIVALAAMLGTASSVSAFIFAADGVTSALARSGQFPPIFGRRLANGWSLGLILSGGLVALFATIFDLSAIASIGSAVSLVIFLMVSIAHLRVRQETGARRMILLLGGVATLLVLLLFAAKTAVDDPGTFSSLMLILLLAVAVNFGWKYLASRQQSPPGEDQVRLHEE